MPADISRSPRDQLSTKPKTNAPLEIAYRVRMDNGLLTPPQHVTLDPFRPSPSAANELRADELSTHSISRHRTA